VQDAIEDNCVDAQSYLRRRPFGVAISAPARMAMAVGTAPESPPGASAKARGCSVPRPGTPSSMLMVTIRRPNNGIVWRTPGQWTGEPLRSRTKDRRQVESTPDGGLSACAPGGGLGRSALVAEINSAQWACRDQIRIAWVNELRCVFLAQAKKLKGVTRRADLPPRRCWTSR
jgi:hypothetical protein